MKLFLLIFIIYIIFTGVKFMFYSSVNHIITIHTRNSATSVERCKRVTFFYSAMVDNFNHRHDLTFLIVHMYIPCTPSKVLETDPRNMD